MLRADMLRVVHHDDTVSEFTDVSYTLDRTGLRVVTATGDEKVFGGHEVLTTHAHLLHQYAPGDARRATADDPPGTARHDARLTGDVAGEPW